MKVQLPRRRPIGPGLVRLAARLVLQAARRMEARGGASVEAVHETRVALKRARSALRLLEKAGVAWARAPRLRLAAAARGLSAAREAAVAQELAVELHRASEGGGREVAALLQAATTTIPAVDPPVVAMALRHEAAGLVVAPAGGLDQAALRAQLLRSLERVQGHHAGAQRQPGRPQLHEWRKSVIILRDQAGLAAGLWPEGAGRAHALLVPLARRLGRLGDLLLLETRLADLRPPRPLAADRRALVAELRADRTWETMACLREWPALARRIRRLLAGPKRERLRKRFSRGR